MTFPIVESVTTSTITTTGLTVLPVDIPAAVNAGDLLVVWVSYYTDKQDASILTAPAAWTKVHDIFDGAEVHATLLHKVADGSEGGTELSLTVTGDWPANAMTAHCYRITAGGELEVETVAPVIQGSSASIGFVDAPEITPSWGSADTLYLIFGAAGRSETSITDPSGYTVLQTSGFDQSSRYANALSGHRASTDVSDDPGTYDYGSYKAMAATALAIRATVPDPSVTTTDTLQPGEDFTLTATNYASAPVSPVTLTDSEGSTITVPVTISGSGPYTAVGTMPTLAEAVTAGTSLLFGDVTIELTT